MNTRSYLQTQAYNAIKDKILSREMEPETLYSETKMSREMNISRTPFREALQCLAQDGYISIIPSKGFKIRTLNRRDLKASIEIRCAVEGYCVYTAAAQHSTESGKKLIRDLEKIIGEMEKAAAGGRHFERFIKHDHRFHERLIDFIGNDEFCSAFQRIHFQMQQTSENSLEIEGRLEETLAEHKRILQEIQNGNVDAAYAEMVHHLKMPLELIMSDDEPPKTT